MKIFGGAALLGLTLGVTAKASAQTPEEALATIERNYAQVQITKNPKTIEAVSAVMADDFYAFDPASGVRGTKKQVLDSATSPKYVVTSMEFPPFFIHVYELLSIVIPDSDSINLSFQAPNKEDVLGRLGSPSLCNTS